MTFDTYNPEKREQRELEKQERENREKTAKSFGEATENPKNDAYVESAAEAKAREIEGMLEGSGLSPEGRDFMRTSIRAAKAEFTDGLNAIPKEADPKERKAAIDQLVLDYSKKLDGFQGTIMITKAKNEIDRKAAEAKMHGEEAEKTALNFKERILEKIRLEAEQKNAKEREKIAASNDEA